MWQAITAYARHAQHLVTDLDLTACLCLPRAAARGGKELMDKDTEGLLLITDNGQLGYQLLLPHKKVTKRYEVVVNERVTVADQEAFANLHRRDRRERAEDVRQRRSGWNYRSVS